MSPYSVVTRLLRILIRLQTVLAALTATASRHPHWASSPHLCRLRRVLEVRRHVDGLLRVRELDERLVPVGAHVELRLHQLPERRRQLPQLLVRRLIGQVADVQHLQTSKRSPGCGWRRRSGTQRDWPIVTLHAEGDCDTKPQQMHRADSRCMVEGQGVKDPGGGVLTRTTSENTAPLERNSELQ